MKKIGDIVYFIQLNCIHESVIEEIRINNTEIYILRGFNYEFSRNMLFDSLEDILNYLIYNMRKH